MGGKWNERARWHSRLRVSEWFHMRANRILFAGIFENISRKGANWMFTQWHRLRTTYTNKQQLYSTSPSFIRKEKHGAWIVSISFPDRANIHMKKKKRKINAPCSDCAMARLNHLHLWRITNVGLRLVIIIRSRETHRERESVVYFVTRRIGEFCGNGLTLVDRLCCCTVQVGRINTHTHTHTHYTSLAGKKKKKSFLGLD